MTQARLVSLVCALGLLLAGCTMQTAGGLTAQPRPNIVFVLVDDMDQGLVQFMPHLRQMQQDGITFTNNTVTDSLCCPSRSSLLTGKYPHNTGVFTNDPPDGGFRVFHQRGEERDTVGTQLQQAGYQTGFLGKYLNGYEPAATLGGDRPFVPPGWNEWAVAGNGYPEYHYKLNVNGGIVSHGDKPEDYLTDVLAHRGDDFIRRNAGAGKPFFLEVAPFVPHAPSTPAPRHTGAFPGLTAPRDPSFNEPDKSDKPEWLRQRPPLAQDQIDKLDPAFRKRAQSLQAVDDMLAGFQRTLNETGQAANTHIVFTSDNGYHMGQHGLLQGKQTAFSTDVNVPLVVTGPGVPAGRTVDQPVENIDLRPTFAELAGAGPAPGGDGQSFAGLLRGLLAPERKNVSLIEHHGPNTAQDDPDRQKKESGNPPTYTAIRTEQGNYVEYVNGEHEYYDRRRDPYELDNIYSQLSPELQAKLHDTLVKLAQCHGADCAAAGRM